jgi:hypothetical protein
MATPRIANAAVHAAAVNLNLPDRPSRRCKRSWTVSASIATCSLEAERSFAAAD